MTAAPSIRVSTLLRQAGVRPVCTTGPDAEILGVGLDSRSIQPGELFFAVPGFRQDGVRFVPQAVERGARAVVAASARPSWLPAEVAWIQVDEPRWAAGPLSRECYGRPDESLILVGITGTNGKTTVAHLVQSIGRAAGRKTGRIGTVGHAVGETDYVAARTTPEAPELYRLLALMRDESVKLVSMEVSSHALALGRVEGARFAVAAFLNLGRDHLDFHESEQAYFETKAQMFDSLGPEQNAVLPSGDAHGDVLASRTRARVWRFGRQQGAAVRMRDEECTQQGSRAVLDIETGSLRIETSLLGRFNLDNVAAAAACALASGLPPESIPGGVRDARGVPGRMEPVDRGQPFAVLVDYAHTEDALTRLLADARELVAGRLLVVFGCGGDRDRGKRPAMGRSAALAADLLYLTSDNPRGEDPRLILDEIRRGVESVPGALKRCRILPDRAEAIAAAIGEAAAGDAVLLAGKGHETTQTIGNRVVELDDRVLAAEALAGLGCSGDAGD